VCYAQTEELIISFRHSYLSLIPQMQEGKNMNGKKISKVRKEKT
jgi:hypothetical protein